MSYIVGALFVAGLYLSGLSGWDAYWVLVAICVVVVILETLREFGAR